MNKLVIFSSLKALLGQSIATAGVCSVHGNYPGSGASMTFKDFKGLTTGNITSYIGGLTANTYHSIYVALPSSATNATNTLMQDYIAGLDVNIIAANRGSVNNQVNTGTCQSNSTTTNIILASTASAVDDYYKGMFIKTTVGGVSTYHYCTGYTGASKLPLLQTPGLR